MTSADDFITHLAGFGLTEKEARCYGCLLNHGPMAPSSLAKVLRTYSEDVRRTLVALVDKGVVRPPLDSSATYTAVELEIILDATLEKHKSTLREMKRRKRELEELAHQQHLRALGEVSTFKIIKSIRECLTIVLPAISDLKEQWDMLVPESAVIMASQLGVNPFTREFIDRGGSVRILVTDFSYALIPLIRELIEMGADVRYVGREALLFTVLDRCIGISAINVDTKLVTLEQPFTALWTDSQPYAHYLTATFELLWKRAVPAAERIQELLELGPPHIEA